MVLAATSAYLRTVLYLLHNFFSRFNGMLQCLEVYFRHQKVDSISQTSQLDLFVTTTDL
jgi:hypothetical protein